MSNITISNLHTVGAELFLDSESYLNEVADEDLSLTYGGTGLDFWISAIISMTVALYVH